ncbi:hypothetical protein B0H14DRAFT_2577120 [Mycena olivaceomarginata]|nr:hypothetical protein B0H14DRAFT_2577120 [Mycena olivaceomarginata]
MARGKHSSSKRPKDPNLYVNIVKSTVTLGDSTSIRWRFGVPECLFDSRSLEEFLKSVGFAVPNFDLMLRDFIAEHFPGDCVAYEEWIQCAHITYQSLEDWRGLRDIGYSILRSTWSGQVLIRKQDAPPPRSGNLHNQGD